MKAIAWWIGVAAVAGIAFAPLAYVSGSLSLDVYKGLALALTIVWFVVALLPGTEEAIEEAVEEAVEG